MHEKNHFITSALRRYLTEKEKDPEVIGYEKYGFTRTDEIITAEYLLLFLALFCLSLVLQFYVGKVWKLHYLPESGATVLLGMFVGGLIRLVGNDTSDSLLGFDATIFFIGFLPPIIFNSGYQINRRLFFKNMGGILLLAVAGTAVSTVIIGVGLWALGQAGLAPEYSAIEYLTFGSLISATDPVSTLAVFSELQVHPTLFYLVFGESVLNDAVSITLFKTMSTYIGETITHEDGLWAFLDFCISCVGSTIIGFGLGMLFAWIFKVVDLTKHRLLLVSLYTGMIYIPFLLSETLQLSGILTLLFSAITARRYISHNIPPEAQRACAFVFELMAYLAETGVFLYLGLDVFSRRITRGYEVRFIFWSLLLCLVSRAVVTYPGLNFINRVRQNFADKKNSLDANLISPGMIHMVFINYLYTTNHLIIDYYCFYYILIYYYYYYY
jgi:sodium/hydrogen exchanger 8